MTLAIIYLAIGALYLGLSYAIAVVCLKELNDQRAIKRDYFISIIIMKLFFWPIDIGYVVVTLIKMKNEKEEMERMLAGVYEEIMED